MNSKKKPSHNLPRRDGPPLNGCCPICSDNFTIPCKTSCGHQYCGSCILEYWRRSVVTLPCKCPTCKHIITKLTPEIPDRKEKRALRVLKEVDEYNSLFSGGERPVVQARHHSGCYKFFSKCSKKVRRMFRGLGDCLSCFCVGCVEGDGCGDVCAVACIEVCLAVAN